MAVYPSGLPTSVDIPDAGADLSTNPHSVLHDDMRDEIVAICAELGVSPSGTFATVAARLTSVQNRLDVVRVAEASLTGGPTSGTTELVLTGSLTIDSASVSRRIFPMLQIFPSGTVAGDIFTGAVRETNVSGTIRQRGRFIITTPQTGTFSLLPTSGFTLSAGNSITLVATLLRTAGTGTCSVASLVGTSFIGALILPT